MHGWTPPVNLPCQLNKEQRESFIFQGIFSDFFRTLFNTVSSAFPQIRLVSVDAGIESWIAVISSILALRQSNHSARSHPQLLCMHVSYTTARSHPQQKILLYVFDTFHASQTRNMNKKRKSRFLLSLVMVSLHISKSLSTTKREKTKR